MFFARRSCVSARLSRPFSRMAGLFACLLFLAAASSAFASGPQVQFSGTIVALGGGFTTPSSLAVDPSGNVYVVNSASSSGTVMEIPVGCQSSSCVTSLGVAFNEPTGVAVDASGDVFVVNFTGTTVTEIPSGCTSSSCTKSLGGGFQNPTGVALDSMGNIYVADYGNLSVKEMGPTCSSSSCVSILGGGTNQPQGLAVDSSGNVYYAAMNPSPSVWEIPLNCESSSCEKALGSGFNQPQGLAVDGFGDVYVVDSANTSLLEIPASCIAGSNNASCMTTLGSFNYPNGVAVDANGNPYVADTNNNAVKEIMLRGVNFFSANVGTPTAAQTLSFTFTEAGAIAVPKLLTQGATGLDFQDAGTGSCTTNGGGHTYSAGASCTVDVTFTPKYPGVRYGVVELTTTTGTAVATAYVYGTGEGPQITFNTGTNQIFLGSGFQYPSEVAVDASGNVYVADPFNGDGEINEILAAGGYSTVENLGSGFDQPVGVAVDGGANVFVADTSNDAVWEMTPACQSTSCMTQMGGGFNHPRAVAVDGAGNIFVADYGNNEVKEIPAGCTNAEYVSGACSVTPLGGGFLFPQGVAVDGMGDVFVGDTGNGYVKEIPPGCLSSSCVQRLAANFSFSGPTGVAVDGGGNVYVDDTGNNIVEEIPPGCAAVACMQFLGNGFNSPTGVAIDGAGDVFVGDSNNGLVDELTFSVVPTFNFAATAPGQTSTDSPVTVFVANEGNQPLNLSTVTYPPDFPEASGVSTDCVSSSTPTAANPCTLSIDFSPQLSSSGSLDEAVSLTDNSLNADPSVTQSIAVTGTAALAPSMTSPTPSSTLSGSSVTFQWNPGAGSTAFVLDVGTTGPGASDIYAGSSTTATSVGPITVPTTGANLFVQLGYRVNGTWQYLEFVYTEAGTLSPPSMTSPTPGSTLSGSSATFQWTPGSGAVAFKLLVGTTGVGASDVYAGKSTTATSVGPLTVPTTGANLYVQLQYLLNGTWTKINYTYTQAGTLQAPSMTSPTPGTTLSGSSVTFQWNPGSGAIAFMLYVGTTGYGSHNVYKSGETTGTSVSVTNVPTTGANLYVQFYYYLNSAWQTIDYLYTQAGTLTPPSMISPAPGSLLSASTATFQWSPGSGNQAFRLDVGTTGVGAYDVYAGSTTTATSVGPLTIPTTGADLYVQLYYQVNGKWNSIAYVYTQAGTLQVPSMTSPAPGTTLSGSSVTFQWNPGSGAVAFKLLVGTTGAGASDVYAGKSTTATSVGPITVPTTGADLYVQLQYLLNGTWTKINYTYTQAGTLQAPSMTSPTPGSTLSGSSVTFQWNPGSGAVAFMLYVGTTGYGSHNVYNSGETTGTSVSVTNVPTTGANLYVQFYYYLNSAWQTIDYLYTQAGTLTPPSMTSPAPGSLLSGSSVTFQWSPGSGNQAFRLDVGTTGVGADDVYAGSTTTATSVGPLTVPTTGADLYVQLYYQVNGKWNSTAYLYTQAGTLAAPSMTSPTPGTTLSGSSATFQWTPGSGAVAYKLLVGTTGVGASDVYAGKSTTATSVGPITVPTTGADLYVELEYEVNGAWSKINYVYTQSGTLQAPSMTSPTPGSTLSGSSVTFQWTPGSGAVAFMLYVGSKAAGGHDVYEGSPTTATSVGPLTVPTTGGKLYVTLWYEVNGAWQSIPYLYTQASPAS